jgi:hypothetical protein
VFNEVHKRIGRVDIGRALIDLSLMSPIDPRFGGSTFLLEHVHPGHRFSRLLKETSRSVLTKTNLGRGNQSTVNFQINNLATNRVIDKDINFYFTVAGAPAGSYTVSGAIQQPDVVYQGRIIGTHNHQDSQAGSSTATVTITYSGLSPAMLTLNLVYYDGTTYGNSGTHDYAPQASHAVTTNSCRSQTDV